MEMNLNTYTEFAAKMKERAKTKEYVPNSLLAEVLAKNPELKATQWPFPTTVRA